MIQGKPKMKKLLLTGNEAIARGAWEAGIRFASAYPGTPSTEILENLAGHYSHDLRTEWAPNEKVALEAAAGASIGGVRSMASMKHVGVNLAADPLFTLAYTGINAGMVLISADEPGQHSSQNEQDNRYYALMAKIPMLEPSTSQEAKDFMGAALSISEEFDTPVLMRLTTRLCHSKGIVEPGERTDIAPREYQNNPSKYVCVPAFMRVRRKVVQERMAKLAQFTETTPLNRVISNGRDTGVIASGMCYCYAQEIFGAEIDYLKLGFTHPLPGGLIRDFCRGKSKIYVIEENDPYIENFTRSLGIDCQGKDIFPPYGEMTPDVLRRSLTGKTLPTIDYDRSVVAPRPPLLCAGCPHRGFFYELGRRKNAVVFGDIGCYSLGFAPPYNAMDLAICMGASFSAGHGLQAALDMHDGNDKRVVSVLGDSTFFHTGINSLIEVFYNNGRSINVILDNRTTGMTGHQENPGTGRRADMTEAPVMEIERMVLAMGFERVRVIDPNDLALVKETLDWAFALQEASVIITRWPCVLKKNRDADLRESGEVFKEKNFVLEDKCVGCRKCLSSGCPAVSVDPAKKKSGINRLQCVGCSICAQLCPKEAIEKEAG